MRAILFCPRESYFPLLSGLGKQFQILIVSLKNQNKKFQPDSDILASTEAGWNNGMAYV